MDESLEARNRALYHIRDTSPKPYKYGFAKLANELTLIVTKVCNIRCIYCYDKSNAPLNKKREEILQSKIKREELQLWEIVNLIRTVKKLGCKRIRITGGDPFMRGDIWEIFDECIDMEVTICTNGTLIKNQKLVEKAKKFSKLHLHISIDGTDTHAKYRLGSETEEIISNTKWIKNAIPRSYISINTVLNSDNVYELTALYTLLKLLKIDRWTVSFPRFGKEAQLAKVKLPQLNVIVNVFKELFHSYQMDGKPFGFTFCYFYKFELYNQHGYILPPVDDSDHPCLPNASGCKGLIIDSFGNVLDCLVMPSLMDKPINIRACLKNEDNPDQLVEMIYGSLKSPYYHLSVKNSEVCMNCRYRNICKGGCPANLWWLTDYKELEGPDPLSCFMFDAFEKDILPILPDIDRKSLEILIDTTKPFKNKEKIKNNHTDLLNRVGWLE
ncbi:MAG: radical SAM protein [Candidatus Marsarchaeota archaeon]|nr:radical SAM protein [Candidatus Marsarchaeota archaeon]